MITTVIHAPAGTDVEQLRSIWYSYLVSSGILNQVWKPTDRKLFIHINASSTVDEQCHLLINVTCVAPRKVVDGSALCRHDDVVIAVAAKHRDMVLSLREQTETMLTCDIVCSMPAVDGDNIVISIDQQGDIP